MRERLTSLRLEMRSVSQAEEDQYDEYRYEGMQFLNIVHLDLEQYLESFTVLTPEIHKDLFVMYKAIMKQLYSFNENYRKVKDAIIFLFTLVPFE